MWLKVADLKVLGVPHRTYHRKIENQEWKSHIVGIGRNGKPVREVLLESLPHELQLKWIQMNQPEETPETETSERSLTEESIEIERRLTESLLRYKPDVREAFRNEAVRLQDIVNRYSIINPKRIKIDGKHEFVPEVLRLCREAVCSDPIVLQVEPKRGKPVSPFTLDGWARNSTNEGLCAFLRKPSSAITPSDNRKAQISAEAVEFLNSKWRQYPSPRHLYRALQKEAKKKKWEIPSETWLRRKYDALPKTVSTLVYQGEKAYNSRYAPFVPRTYADLDALQVLCGDHSVRDVTVLLPSGEITRPWLTVWYDLRTGLIWGWHLDLTPSSNTIGLAYVNGCQTFGAQPIYPDGSDIYSYLQTDQGRDYRSKTLTGQTLTFKKAAKIEGGLNALCSQRKIGFIEEMGLKHLMARGYNAKEKAVERVFRDISDWEQNYFQDEYVGRDAKNKPERWVKAWHRHDRLQKKFKDNPDYIQQESPFIRFEDYKENLANFILEFNTTTHIRAVLGGAKIVPMQEYERLYTTRFDISNDALALLLMKASKRKIGKDGIQMFQQHWYFLHEAMSDFKGEEVEVRYTDGDYSRIWAILPNGKIVEASLITPSSIISPNKKTMEAIAKQKAHERKVVRDFRFIQESNWRGETAEDRVAQLVNEDFDHEPEAQKIAVNQPRIHNMTRFDTPKLTAVPTNRISTEDVESAEIIDIFRENKTTKIKEEWE